MDEAGAQGPYYPCFPLDMPNSTAIILQMYEKPAQNIIPSCRLLSVYRLPGVGQKKLAISMFIQP